MMEKKGLIHNLPLCVFVPICTQGQLIEGISVQHVRGLVFKKIRIITVLCPVKKS